MSRMTISRFRGARVKRIEDPNLLVGRGTFVDNIAVPGVWHVAVVRSPHAHARIRKVRGPTKYVVTARTLGRSITLPGAIGGGAVAPAPGLAAGQVHRVGTPVALGQGRTPEAAGG